MLVQQLDQLAVRFFVLECFFEEIPEFEIRQKIRGAFFLKLLLRTVGRFSAVERTLTRILHRQCGGNDEHFSQTLLAPGGKHHTRDAWIDRKLRELPADLREL